MLGSIQETTRLAVLGEVDRQEAMKATLAIQSAFKQNTEELSESINFLNAVENQTSTTLNDLVEAIPKAGPVIQGLGGSVQDLALYLTAMREGGINASEGANALKSALASLINPTDVAVEKFGALGIDLLGIVNKNAGDLTGTLMALQGSLDRLDPLQKQQAIEQLFGKFQFSRLNALFENLGRQGSQTLQVLDLMKASSSDLASVADRELSAVTESASGRYRRALESLKASLAEVGEQFLTINTVLIQVIDKVVQFANNLPGPVKQILALLGGITAIIGPVIMLTGVLANFFGYLLKGASHMKAFLKGGEGWKYLTPEMLAAEKAGKLVEQSFYSDAKAAAVLQQALRNLIDEFAILEGKAKSGAISVNPAVSTMAGNLVMAAGGQRVVNPQHPLAGPMGTRASSHMVPRAGMNEQERLSQTMFGMVPGSGMVNQKIGQNPQIYMNDALPNVPGLTSVGGVSTGVVSGEAARWHAMMATLAMQSKAEIEALKKQIVATGVVSKDFMMQFDDILPVVSKLTDNAARESAVIVAELRAGKMTVEAAKAKIIALNLETERMIASAVGAQASAMGRTINPTMVPTLNQPVVDASGKSNMRELFKKGKTRDFINKIAGALGVRTSGAGYNMETTVPRKMNSGGYVYTMNDGNIVPGPNVDADVVPAMLTPGEFVVNAQSTRENLGLLKAINSGGSLGSSSDGYMPSGVSNSILGAFGYNSRSNKEANLVGRWGMILPQSLNDALAGKLGGSGANGADIIAALQEPGRLIDLEDFLLHNGVSPAETKSIMKSAAKDMASKIVPGGKYRDAGLGSIAFSAIDPKIKALESKYPGISLAYQKDRMTPGRRDTRRTPRPGETQAQANKRGGSSPTGINIPGQRPSNYGSGATRGAAFGQNQVWAHLDDMEFQKNTSMLSRSMGFIRGIANPRAIGRGLAAAGRFAPGRRIPGAIKFNKGGMVPGYNMGGMVDGYNMGGMVQGYNRGGFVKSMLGGSAIAMGGQMLGNQIGGGLGSAISMGSGLLGSMYSFGGMSGGRQEGASPGILGRQMDKIPAQLKQPVGPLNSLSAAASKTAGNLSGIARVFGPLLKGFTSLLRLTSPLGLGLTAVGATVAFLIKKHKEHTEELRVNRFAFGMTADAAAKAGYKYTDYNKQIKSAIEDAKALKAQNKMIYESMTNANVPIKMTIEQYKKLKEQVKSTMGDYIKLFDQTNRKDVGQVAVQLKAQFMAAGDTAEEATAKIYALISESNKASMAGNAIGTKAFQSIQNLQQAAIQTTKTFEAALVASDTKGQAAALLSSFQAINASIDDTVSKSAKAAELNNGAAITVGEATKNQIDSLNTSYKNQSLITKDIIDEIGKQDPELAKVLNTTDSLTSSWAKYQLIVQGVNIDVANLSGTAAIAAAKLSAIVTDQVRSNKAVAAQYTAYGKLKTQIKDLEKASRGQSAKQQIDSRDAIAALNKQIDKIRKAAQEKLDGIRKSTEAENTQLEIQKAQLRAQQALATGNMTSYAEEQMSIEQLLNDANRKAAEEAITAKAELDIKPLQDQIDALGKKNQKLADKAALAGESLASLQKKASTLNDNLTSYTTNLSNLLFKLQTQGEDFKMTDEFKETMKALEVMGKKIGIKESPQSIVDALSTGLKNVKNVTIYTDQVNSGKMSYTKADPLDAETLNLGKLATRDGGILTDESKKKVVQEAQLQEDDYFEYKGKTYKVKSVTYVKDYNGKNWVNNTDVVAQKALGGAVSAGQKYIINDRINALGVQGEGFIPNVSGTIYPNAATMPKFDMPTDNNYRIPNITNSPNSNNMYSIDINLNGTNVTADDVMRKFKQELALINAKEGVNRYVGGNV